MIYSRLSSVRCNTLYNIVHETRNTFYVFLLSVVSLQFMCQTFQPFFHLFDLRNFKYFETFKCNQQLFVDIFSDWYYSENILFHMTMVNRRNISVTYTVWENVIKANKILKIKANHNVVKKAIIPQKTFGVYTKMKSYQ